MDNSILKTVSSPARLLWRVTGQPIYRRLFGQYFEATISRLNATLGELHALQDELRAARAELAACRAEQEELGLKMQSIITGHWDAIATARRLATIEDRLVAGGTFIAEDRQLDADEASRAQS